MFSIHEEMTAFLMAVISGVIVRMFYQCITCFRKLIKHNHFAIEIEDFIFWIGSAVYVFVQIYHTTNGGVRWYFVLGIVIGALIATVFLRKWEKVMKKIYDFHAGKNIAKNAKKRYYNRY